MGGSKVKLGWVGLVGGELAHSSKDGKIMVFSAGETGGDTMVEGEGASVWEAGEV